MSGDHQPMPTAARRSLVVVLRDERTDTRGEFMSERGAIRCGREADFGVDCQCGKRPSGVPGVASKLGHLSNQSRRDGDQVCGGKSVCSLRVGRVHAKNCGRQDI